MRYLSPHPALDKLSDFVTSSDPESRARITSHLETCQSCRDTVQLLRGISASSLSTSDIAPSPDLLTRIIESRAADARVILPIGFPTGSANSTRKRVSLIAAAVVIMVAIGGVLATRNASDVEAGGTSGTLILSPAMPRAGQAITVTYRAAAMFTNQTSLALRTRMRDANEGSYNTGIPTVTAAMLRRGADGVFSGHFTFPDSIVYAALVVADTGANSVDDNANRDWELLVADSVGRPTFEALNQRANDMMGRNWEEGFATARRMVALYPHNLRTWIWFRLFNSWLGNAADDSVRASDRARLAAFDSVFATGVATDADIGRMAWYADRIDSTTAARWRAKLMRQAPENSIAVQWRMFAILDTLHQRNDTTVALRRMDVLWNIAPQDRKAQVAEYATTLAFDVSDTTLIKRWTMRLMLSERDRRSIARRVATQFSKIPALRAQGIELLRSELDSVAVIHPADRALNESLTQQRARHDANHRALLATLGQALVASGDYAAARGVLDEAASSGWNLEVFRAVRLASLTAGDTSRALTMAARVSVDPRTPAAFSDSLRPLAERILGTAGWRAVLDTARKEFVKRMLANASARSVRGDPQLRAIDGKTTTISALAQGRVTVIAFWSRTCAPAVEDLPRMNAVAARLARSGVRVVSVVDEASSSPALKQFLRDNHVTMPTYMDTWHDTGRAFNQWSTPDYYVIDADGRIRFGGTNSAEAVLARAEALRMSAN